MNKNILILISLSLGISAQTCFFPAFTYTFNSDGCSVDFTVELDGADG